MQRVSDSGQTRASEWVLPPVHTGERRALRGENSDRDRARIPAGIQSHREKFCVRAIELALVFLISLLINILIQSSAGAYAADFAGYSDEGAHYVTGLMVRDYVAAGLPQPALEYARGFHSHYPKVAMGHWPPVFYIVEAAWMLLFSAGRVSVLLLMAVLTSFLAVLVYWRSCILLGRVAGVASTGMLLLISEMQRQTSFVMPEVLVAIWALLAAVAFGRFIDTENWRHSLWFAVFASLAILTKGNGWALGLLPPLAILLSGKLKLVFHPALWIGAAVVAMLCIPWQVVTMHVIRHVWIPSNVRPESLNTAYHLSRQFLLHVAGPVGGALFLAGFSSVTYGLVRRRFEFSGTWGAMAALFVAVLVFNALVPLHIELRKMLAAVPPFVMLTIAGVEVVARALRFIPLSRVIVPSVAVVAVFGSFTIPAKLSAGFREAAMIAMAQPLPPNAAYLISASGAGEGAFIAEIAMHDQRPGRVVIRASKALAESDWNSTHYRLLFETTEALRRELERLSVGLIVLEDSPLANSLRHHSLLARMIEEHPREWAVLMVVKKDESRGVRIFCRTRGPESNRPVATSGVGMTQ